ncbi:hypothetical protein LCGC14_1881330, partial [marine sediment metagenome]
VEAAGFVGAGIASGGASAADDPGAQVDSIKDALKTALEPIGNVGKIIKKRVCWNTI